jgi:predicted Fe-Mo cluster-binding NifX family protein
MFADKQIKMVIAGKFGSNMTDSPNEKGIKTCEMKGIAKEAFAKIKETEEY